MLISNEKNFIFIHIYKTAGTSVSKVFVPKARMVDRIAYDFKLTSSFLGRFALLMNWQDNGFKQFTGFHKHSKAFEVKEKIGVEKYNSFFKFVFVRNPFDLLVSLYHYINQSPEHISYSKVNVLTFKEFVFYYISQKPNCQIDFLTDFDSKEIIVDYIGRFESLDSDIEKISEIIGLSNLKRLPHKNHSKDRKNISYRTFYDKETIIAVTNYFSDDLQMLEYNF